MKILSWAEFKGWKTAQRSSGLAERPFAATVGVFDGLHIGHKTLIEKVRSKNPAMASVVLTFRESPKKILRPSSFHGDLLALEDKLEALEGCGIDFCVLIDFSADFSTLSGVEFLHALGESGVAYLAMGPDFRCGYRNDTDAEALAELCRGTDIEAEIVGPVLWAGHAVSSTRIRHAVIEGRLEDAAHMLGRPYGVELAAAAPGSSIREPGSSAREPGTFEAAGRWAARKFAAGRVVPPSGLYAAEILLEKGCAKTAVRLSPEGASIEDPRGREAAGIVFLNMVSREF
ncbi:MAG: FAD synthetase family protein [Rectinemataceae bacterium]